MAEEHQTRTLLLSVSDSAVQPKSRRCCSLALGAVVGSGLTLLGMRCLSASSGGAAFLGKPEATVDFHHQLEAQMDSAHYCGSAMEWKIIEVVQNNLGGHGPDRGSEGLKIKMLEIDHGRACLGDELKCHETRILELHSRSEYHNSMPFKNGVDRKMGVINVDSGTSTEVNMFITDAATGDRVTPEVFPLGFFDIDENPDDSGREFVAIHTAHEDVRVPDAWVTRDTMNGHERYIAMKNTGMTENPVDPFHLSPEQEKRVAVFFFEKQSEVTLTLGVVGGIGARRFSFSPIALKEKPCLSLVPAVEPRALMKYLPFLLAGLVASVLICCAACVLRYKSWRYRDWVYDALSVPGADAGKRASAVAEMKEAFRMKDGNKYRAGLELALDVGGVPPKDIPLVFKVGHLTKSFQQLSRQSPTITAEVCFVLDYTGSMGAQMEEVKSCLGKLMQEVETLYLPHNPGGKVKLSVSAVAYNDWDPETAKLGRPVVSVLGGREVREPHTNRLTSASFNLGGKFSTDVSELEQFVGQALGHGGQLPEELTGGLIAASHLPWSADIRLCVVITDAPCHGRAYHDANEDTFADPRTGLTCSGSPEVPLRALKAKEVELLVLHTGKVDKMLRAFRRLLPTLRDGNVNPSETGSHILREVKERLLLQPLQYLIGVHGLDDVPDTVPAYGAVLDVKGCGDSRRVVRIGADGLAWFGCHGRDFTGTPEVRVLRGHHAVLDQFWGMETGYQRLVPEYQDGFAAVCGMPTRA